MYIIIKSKKNVKELVNRLLEDEQFIISGINKESINCFNPDQFWFKLHKKNSDTPILNSWRENGNYPMTPQYLSVENAILEIWTRRKEINDYTRKYNDYMWNKEKK